MSVHLKDNGCDMARKAHGRLIVGVNGRSASVEALRWAVRHAAGTGSAVDAVIAWQSDARRAKPPSGGRTAIDVPGALLTAGSLDAQLASEARRTADRAVRRALLDEPGVHVRVWAMRGAAASVLSELAGPTDLLVVGPGRHRAHVGALSGSVTSYLISHARCPVVVVRGSDETDGPDPSGG